MNTFVQQRLQGRIDDFQKNRVLVQLISTAPECLTSRLHLVQMNTGDTIYDVGDRVNYIYFPLDCIVSSLAVLQDGATVETSMFGYDSVVGLSSILGTRQSQYWTQVSMAGYLAKLDLEDLIVAFNNNNHVAKIILETYERLVTQVSQRSVCNARHSVMERFCCWLLMVHDRQAEGKLKFTHEQVATRLGTRRAGITVAARSLFEDGLVEYKRGLLKVNDRKAIENLACECYHVLRLNNVNGDSTPKAIAHLQPSDDVVLRMNRAPKFEFPPRRLAT